MDIKKLARSALTDKLQVHVPEKIIDEVFKIVMTAYECGILDLYNEQSRTTRKMLKRRGNYVTDTIKH